ncbi:MAG: LapA family protein [bacterium]|nr:LapA family protein [bacterium]
MQLKMIAVLILILLIILFAIQNAAVDEIHFLFWTARISRALIIFFSMALGVALGATVSRIGR